MDQRTRDVEEDLKDILRTRLALADKLQMLEQRVEATVQGTKTAALDVINHAKNTAVEFVESATSRIDPRVQAERNPWLLVGGAVAIGLLAGWMEQRRKRSGVYAYYPPRTEGAEVMPSEEEWEHRRGVYPFYPAQGEARTGPAESSRAEDVRPGERQKSGARRTFDVLQHVSSLWGDFTGQFAKERMRLQEAALEAGRSFLQDMAHILAQSLIDAIERRPPPRRSRLDRAA